MIKIRKMVIHCEIDLPDTEALEAFKNEVAEKFETAVNNVTVTHEDLKVRFNPAISRK